MHATHDLALRALRKYIMQRTQRNELLHGKGRPTVYKMETLKVAVLFIVFASVKKASTPKTLHFGQEILFHTRDERGEFSLFNVWTRPRIISSQLPILPSLIVLLSEVGPATATIRSVKRRHVIGQTLHCLREIRTWLQLSSCVACVALLA